MDLSLVLAKVFKGYDQKALVKYFKNTGWLILERVTRILMTMIVGILLTRYLGPKEYGVYSYVQGYVGLFMALPSLGMGIIILRDAFQKEDKGTYLGTAVFLQLAMACLTVGIIWMSIQFQNHDSRTNWLILILSTQYIFQAFNNVDYFFQSHTRAKYSVIVQSSTFFFLNGLKIWAILDKADLWVFVVLLTGEFVLYMLGYLLIYKWLGYRITEWKFDWSTAKEIVGQSWYYLFALIATMIYLKIDQIMIKHMLGDVSTGLYAAAVKFSEAAYFIPVILCNSLVPAIAIARSQDLNRYEKRLKQLYSLLWWLPILGSIFVTLISDKFILVTLGESYFESAAVLRIHIWASIFVFIGTGVDRWLLSEKKYGLQLFKSVLGVIVNISLNYLLIPKFGIIGAAVATLVTYLSTGLLYLFLFRNTRSHLIIVFQSLFGIGRLW